MASVDDLRSGTLVVDPVLVVEQVVLADRVVGTALPGLRVRADCRRRRPAPRWPETTPSCAPGGCRVSEFGFGILNADQGGTTLTFADLGVVAVRHPA